MRTIPTLLIVFMCFVFVNSLSAQIFNPNINAATQISNTTKTKNIKGHNVQTSQNLAFTKPVCHDTISSGHCVGDGYSIVVNNKTYNEANPVGTETFVGNNGCDSIVQVTLTFSTRPPSFDIKDALLCTGDSLLLKDDTLSGPGLTYLWNTGQTSSSIMVSPAVTSVYTLVVTNAACSVLDTAKVTILQAVVPPSVADITICSGETATIDAGLYDSYFWSTDDTTQIISVNPAVSTTYELIVSNLNFQPYRFFLKKEEKRV